VLLERLVVQRNPLFVLLNSICEALGLNEQVRHRVPGDSANQCKVVRGVF
jgi:hypothetical protein